MGRAIGFGPVTMDIYSEYPVAIPAQVQTPQMYNSPKEMLFNAMWVSMGKYGILKFVIPIGTESHPNSNFTYDRVEIANKFANFLRKVYPDLQIEVSYLEKFKYSVKTFVLNFFYQSMNFTEDIYTVECSAHRLLNEKELQKIYRDMDGATTYKWHIEQFFCETCKQHHPDAPYHIEVVYDR